MPYMTNGKRDYKKELEWEKTSSTKRVKDRAARNKARKEAREKAKASLGKNAANADLILDEAMELIIDKMVLDKQ